ncbi:MAG: ATP-dependent zinc protease [Coleofasciculaceae cyanobacterium SM2_3_26]|nr:ATP-dependent zinc protease [Coleofasciculaceae cyanobacterium SM2_3_26]
MSNCADKELPVIGWREWLALPDLGIGKIKAKIDTGARSSAIHAFDISPYEEAGRLMVRFSVHPYQRDRDYTIAAQAPVLDRRSVRSSSGQSDLRYVVLTDVLLADGAQPGCRWAIELTLTNRDMMGFRMLLGRQAVRRCFLVDPGRSFLFGDEPDDTDEEDEQ